MSMFEWRKAPVFISAILAYSGLAEPAAYADDPKMDAGTVMEKMEPSGRFPYVAGVVEGLAMARYQRDNEHAEGDNKSVTGMKCIYGWFYDTPGRIDSIYVAFGKYPRYPAGLIIDLMVRKECGG